jgi:DNA-binding transcriptional MerR regulator
MSMPMIRRLVTVLLVLTPLFILDAACSTPPEQQPLTQFFRAARNRDATSLSMMASVSIDPRTQGAVESFTITGVSEERRAPLDFKSLTDAIEKAQTDEREFQIRKKAYSDANLKTIEEILKLERTDSPKFTPAQTAVKTEWDKWRAETADYVRNLTTTKAALVAATAPVEVSLTQPGQAKFDAAAFQGETVTKDVTVAAQVKSPAGDTAEKALTVTMMKVVGTQAGTARDGKWIVTKVAGL